MNSFTKNVLGSAVGVVAILGSFWFIGREITRYLDQTFGRGAAGFVFILLAGIVIALVIMAVVMFFTNRTHEAAGTDITDFNSANIKATVGMLKILELAQRGMQEPRILEAKAMLEDRKAQNKVWAVQETAAAKAQAKADEWAAKQERKAYEAALREQRQQIEEEELQEYWYGGDGSDVVVE